MVRIVSFIAVMLGLGWSTVAHAAAPSITLQTTSALLRADEIVPIEVHVDSAGQRINAVEITLRYSSPGLTIVRVVGNENTLTLWPQPPHWDAKTGTLNMVGGRPGGLIAMDALMATIFVRASAPALYQMVLDPNRSGLYVHDGRGTRIAPGGFRQEIPISDPLVGGLHVTSTTHPDADTWYPEARIELSWEVDSDTEYSYRLSRNIQDVPDATPEPCTDWCSTEPTIAHLTYPAQRDGAYYFTIRSRNKDSWSFDVQRAILIDTTPPDPFFLEHIPGRQLHGTDALAWQATDGGSGVARSELRVGRAAPRIVKSPVVADDSWTGQQLRITVVDAAGNTRQAALRWPGHRTPAVTLKMLIVPAALFFLILGWVQWRAYQRKRHRHRTSRRR